MKEIKRWLSICLACCLMLTVLQIDSVAASNSIPYAVEDGNIYFNSRTGEISSADRSITAAEIPAEINGTPVTSIGDEAFQYCTSLEYITIPEGVASIGNYAFVNCSSLTSVKIPEGVESIGEYAFRSCSRLAEVKLPETVSTIGRYAFAFCSELTEIVIPDGVSVINEYTFYNCKLLTQVDIPDSVISLGDQVFRNCESLTTIDLPSNLLTIGNFAFYYCPLLNSIEIPHGTTSIGNYAFSDCYCLEKLTLPTTITSIGKSAFRNCYNLPSVVLPYGITSIGDHTFAFCEKMTSVTIPDTVTSIGAYAFNCCFMLSGVDIPNGVDVIEEGTFANCMEFTSVTIPDGVTVIKDSAFFQCENLNYVDIPDTVTTIEQYAFYECAKLNAAIIPENVVSIGTDAFYGCPNLAIYGIEGSCAEQYALENEIPFISAAIVSLAGRVQDQNGNALANVLVSLYDITTGRVQSELTTDAMGFWKAPQSFVGHTYRISYYHKDYQGGNLEQIVTLGEESVYTGTVTLLKINYRTSGTASVDKLTLPELADAMDQKTVSNLSNLYTISPSITIPYSSGQVRNDLVQAGLYRMNHMRQLAGLSAVTINETYAQYCQDGSLLNAINNQLSHGPLRPTGIDDALYDSGYTGTSRSNLALHYNRSKTGGPLAYAVDMYLDDSDKSNVAALGHRRWVLNPTMGQSAFGCVENGRAIYSSLYAFDQSGEDQNYDFIGWPASGNFASEIFDKNCAWSVSLNPAYYAKPVRAEISVTLTEMRSGNTWIFCGTETYTAAGSGKYFNVNNAGYGIDNCIIFRPDGIKTYDGLYCVTIEGIKDVVGNPVDFHYYVNFHSAADYNLNVNSGWCGFGLEWMQKDDGTLCVHGVNELDCQLALATYRDGKMIDIDYVSADELDCISLSVSCSSGMEAKLCWVDDDMVPITACWSKQF